jgi:predicted MFS family arabinose efflux permease
MSPLRDRRFVLLLAGQAVNGIGSWCALVALWGYAAYKYDAGPLQIALLSLSWSLLGALLGPIGGVPVDRFGPRKALIVADGFSVIVAIGLAFSTSYWQLVALGALIGATRAVSEPAFTALAPRLVDDEQLLRANALLGAAMMSSIAFGPLLAAGAISAWGPRGAFLIDAATYLVGIAVVLPLRLSKLEKVHDHAPSALRELREGLAIVRERIDVRYILGLSGSVYLVWGAYAVIEPIYVRDILERPASTFALLQAAFGIMLLLNALLVSRLGERVAHMGTLRLAALGSAAAAPIYVGTNWVVAAFIGIAIWGTATAWLIAPRDTLLQRATPVAAHGRVLALDSALRSAGHVVALPTAALFIEAFGVRATAFVFAAMPVLGVLATRRASDPGPRAEQTPRVDPGFMAVTPAD